MGAISLIEVEGNVFMATPDESAKGDKGDYQVDEKLLHLFGDNVILTRDKNILRGTEMVYNLETGRSVLTNHGTKVGPNGGRVRGVFVPNQDNGKNGNAKVTKTKKKPGDGATPANTNPSLATAPAAGASGTQGAPPANGAAPAAQGKSNP
jgi:lipopolysaccharide export system protein LptA